MSIPCRPDTRIVKDKIDWKIAADSYSASAYLQTLLCFNAKTTVFVPLRQGPNSKPIFTSTNVVDMMNEIKQLCIAEKRGYSVFEIHLHGSTGPTRYYIYNKVEPFFVTEQYLISIEKSNPNYYREADILKKRFYEMELRKDITYEQLAYSMLKFIYFDQVSSTKKLVKWFVKYMKVKKEDIPRYEDFFNFFGKKLLLLMNMTIYNYLNTIVSELYQFDRLAALYEICQKYIDHVNSHRDEYYGEIAKIMRKYNIYSQAQPFKLSMYDLAISEIYTKDVHDRVNVMRKKMGLPKIASPLYKIPLRKIAAIRRLSAKKSKARRQQRK